MMTTLLILAWPKAAELLLFFFILGNLFLFFILETTFELFTRLLRFQL